MWPSQALARGSGVTYRAGSLPRNCYGYLAVGSPIKWPSCLGTRHFSGGMIVWTGDKLPDLGFLSDRGPLHRSLVAYDSAMLSTDDGSQ